MRKAMAQTSYEDEEQQRKEGEVDGELSLAG